MTEGTEHELDPAFSAIQRAAERISTAPSLRQAMEPGISGEVSDAVEYALGTFDKTNPRSPEGVLAGYVAEVVAVASISRSATGERPMTHAEINSVKDFLRSIFNGIFDR